MDWSIVIPVAIAAALAVAVGFLADRGTAQRRRELLSSAPNTPELTEEGVPDYVDPESVRAKDKSLTSDEREKLHRLLGDAISFDCGWASRGFITDDRRQWAVVDDPLILTVDRIIDMRQLYLVFDEAKARDKGVVVVAKQIDTPVIAGLALNAQAGTLSCVAVISTKLHEIAQATGSQLVTGEDLQAGYLPEGSLGSSGVWVSGPQTSWIITG